MQRVVFFRPFLISYLKIIWIYPSFSRCLMYRCTVRVLIFRNFDKYLFVAKQKPLVLAKTTNSEYNETSFSKSLRSYLIDESITV